MNGTTKKDDKIVAGRSKSADSKWKDRMNRGLGNMSKSLPSFNKVLTSSRKLTVRCAFKFFRAQ